MFELDYTLTRAHLARFQKLIPQRMKAANGRDWRSALALWLILVLISALTILAVTKIEGQAPDDISVFAGLIIGVGVMWAIWMYRALTMRKFWLRDGGPTLSVHHTIADDTGLRFSTPAFESLCRWPAVLDLTEHEDIIVVWIEVFHGFVIPRSAFKDEATGRALVAFARQHIGPQEPATPGPWQRDPQ